MDYIIRKLTDENAIEICNWRYQGEYGVYNLYDYDTIVEKGWSLGIEERRDREYVGIFHKGELIGYGRISTNGTKSIIGIGLKPIFCGIGYGRDVMELLIKESLKRHKQQKITLEVRTFNKRAIKCYLNMGFVIKDRYMKDTLNGKGEFLYMEYDKNKFTLNTVTIDVAMDIYSTNKDYFKMSSGEEPTIESVIRDKNEIPPNSSLENKNYKLISMEGNHIGIIDYIESYPDEDAVYIGLLLIHGNFQGLGYGSSFVECFVEDMGKRGYKRIRLGVLKENDNAFRFWTRLGFEVVKEVTSTIHPDKNWKIKVMEKNIK